jgi:glycine cleavage system H protein
MDLVKIDDYELKEGLYYSKDHLWVSVEKKLARVGITDYAQKSLHEVVLVELPSGGSETKKGESFGIAESVKAVSDLISPLSGIVKEVNEELRDKPELLNEDPYGSGWLLVLEPKKLDEELKSLMTFGAAKEWTRKLLKES